MRFHLHLINALGSFFVVCLLILRAEPAAQQDKGRASKEPPYKRLLTDEAAVRVAGLQNKMAGLIQAGKFAEAVPLAKEIADIRVREQGADTWQVAYALWDFKTYQKLASGPATDRADYVRSVKMIKEAAKLYAGSRPAEAEPLARTALELRRKILGEEHPDTAHSYAYLALMLMGQDKHADAEPACRKAQMLYEKLLPAEHSDIARSCENLALNLNFQGRYAAAEPFSRKSLAIRQKIYGDDHADMALSLRTAAYILRGQGKYAEAEPLLRKALAIKQRLLGEEHRETGYSYRDLARNLDKQGRYSEAEPLDRRALVIMRKVLGDEHPVMDLCYNDLAINLLRQRKWAAAEVLFRKLLSEDRSKIAARPSNLGACLARQGRYSEAEPLLRNALAMVQDKFGERNPETALAYYNLAQILRARSQYRDAEPFFRKALAIREKVLGEEHPDTAASYLQLAATLKGLGQNTRAEQIALQAARSFTRARLYLTFQGVGRALVAEAESPFLLLAGLQAHNGKPLAAWQSLESDLARGLLDDLSARYSRPLSAAERDRESQLLKKLQRLDDRVAALITVKKPTLEPEKTTQLAEQERDKLRRVFSEFQQELAHKYGPAAGQIFERVRIQAQLTPDSALLAWVDSAGPTKAADVNGDHWACVLRSKGDPVWIKLAGGGLKGRWTEDDDKLPDAVRSVCAAGPGNPGKDGIGQQQLIQRLTRQRLAPLEQHLQPRAGLPAVKHLIVLPSRHLLGVPIEVLTDRYTISYAPSGTLFAWLQEKKRPQNEPVRLLAVGDPAFAAPTELAKEAPLAAYGVLVMGVVPHSNAARAGLKADDVMLRYSDTKLAKSSDLTAAIKQDAGAGADKKIIVQVWRNGKSLSLQVAPGPLGVQLHEQSAAELLAARRQGDRVVRAALDKTYPRLDGTRREVEAIARLFPASTKLLGAQASAQALETLAEKEQLGQFRYLHLATHGDLNNCVALQSALVLAAGSDSGNSRVTAEQMLRTWKLDADLVTLSACQTGLGQPAGGEGYLGFSQALFIAGARSLVLSLWQVDDTATALLMVRFYENLLGGRTGLKKPMAKAEALAEAKRWLRNLTAKEAKTLAKNLPPVERIGTAKGRPLATTARPYEHPYYWAAFILIGDPR